LSMHRKFGSIILKTEEVVHEHTDRRTDRHCPYIYIDSWPVAAMLAKNMLILKVLCFCMKNQHNHTVPTGILAGNY